MTSRPGQFHVEFSDGLTLDRLPVGLAVGTLYVPFVITGRDWRFLLPGEPYWLSRELDARLRITASGADLRHSGGGGGGGDAVQTHTYEFRGLDQSPILGEALLGLRVAYLFDGEAVAEEFIDLSHGEP